MRPGRFTHLLQIIRMVPFWRFSSRPQLSLWPFKRTLHSKMSSEHRAWRSCRCPEAARVCDLLLPS